jgi:hypothetical protein
MGSLFFPAVFLFLFLDAVFVIWLWKEQREFLITMFLIVALVILVAFPLFFWVNNCVRESIDATNDIRAFIESNPEFQELLNDYKNSRLYKEFLE